ncbi:TetR family transcriptional regulator [Herbidospora sp. NEAU-GS84]|uniref:TetR family transcriptional regulator n=1 Tax=Herbidospora solisilvae TaxID=2696284 RepID=A0A7C9JA09_9ACTN|nr:helix-turn-helix domain-containing protein [Herbidospora solisilvae]NAS24288.1 TetR family transcriptional regulator [Herbidospora solisilvae]
MNARDRLLAAAVDYFAAHGVGDASLRTIATGLGTSHRMLIYHFGSREGLLSEVVREVETRQRDALAGVAWDVYWDRLVDQALVYGPLFFELSAHAMQGRPHTEGLRADLIDGWLPPLVDLCVAAGVPEDRAPAYARLSLAATRGLLFDLILSGDRAGVDAALAVLASMFEEGFPHGHRP